MGNHKEIDRRGQNHRTREDGATEDRALVRSME